MESGFFGTRKVVLFHLVANGFIPLVAEKEKIGLKEMKRRGRKKK